MDLFLGFLSCSIDLCLVLCQHHAALVTVTLQCSLILDKYFRIRYKLPFLKLQLNFLNVNYVEFKAYTPFCSIRVAFSPGEPLILSHP